MSFLTPESIRFRPLAREKLANVAGIVAGHPGLKLDVEGHTDSVGGGSDYNQKLSEERSNSVRDYLTQHGMQSAAVTAKGLGKTQPVSTNDTANGRQQNRRVELVISGDVIGTEMGTYRGQVTVGIRFGGVGPVFFAGPTEPRHVSRGSKMSTLLISSQGGHRVSDAVEAP